MLCGLGFVAAAVTAYLDERGMAELGRVSLLSVAVCNRKKCK